MAPASFRVFRLHCVLLAGATVLAGCEFLPTKSASQEWLISDGCVVWVKGLSVEQYQALERIIRIGDDCEIEVEGSIE